MDVEKRPPHWGIPKLPEDKEPAPIPPQLPPPYPQAPAVGASVVYMLAESDQQQAASSAASRVLNEQHTTGEPIPAIVTRVNFDGTVNLHLLLDGPATHWVARADYGEEEAGTWRWL